MDSDLLQSLEFKHHLELPREIITENDTNTVHNVSN